jgi:hypothetical protein
VQRNKRLSLVRHIAFSFYFALPVCLLVEDSSYPRKQMKHLLTGLPDYNSLRSCSASPSGPICAKKQAIPHITPYKRVLSESRLFSLYFFLRFSTITHREIREDARERLRDEEFNYMFDCVCFEWCYLCYHLDCR